MLDVEMEHIQRAQTDLDRSQDVQETVEKSDSSWLSPEIMQSM